MSKTLDLDQKNKFRLINKDYEQFRVKDVNYSLSEDSIFLELDLKEDSIKTILNNRDDSLIESMSMKEFLNQQGPEKLFEQVVEDLLK